MNMGKKSHEWLVEQQKREIERKMRRKMRKGYPDFCEITCNGLFEETVEWLNRLGYKVYLVE